MGKRRRVPEDLMGVILGESPAGLEEERPPHAGEGSLSWEQPGRVGVAFNLSKGLVTELEGLRQELRFEDDVRPARSEIAEVALQIAAEDVRRRGQESELYRRLSLRAAERSASAVASEVAGEAGQTTRRSVDASGFILETTYDENGEIVDEDVVGSLADLPVEEEFLDEEGRIISRVRDESGTVIEQILDDRGNLIGVNVLG